jgi:vancomycin resistance protein YoaR
MTSTTDTVAADPSLDFSSARRFGWGEALFGFFLTVLAIAVLAVAFVFGLGQAFASRAMPGVAVGGVSIAGLDRGAAEARLRAELPSLSAGRLTLALDGRETVIPYADARRDYDMLPMLNDAFSAGREGNAVEQGLDRLASLVRGTAVSPRVRYDVDAIRAAVSAAAAAVGRPAVDAAVKYRGATDDFVVTQSADGRAVDEAAAQAAVAEELASVSADSSSVSVSAQRVEPEVTTADALAAKAAAEAMTATKLTLTAEEDKFDVKPATLRRWLTFQLNGDGTYGAAAEPARVSRTVKAFAADVDRLPKNAGFKFSNGRATSVVAGKNGHQLDVAGSATKVAAALAGIPAGGSPKVELAMAVTPPTLTTAEAKALRPKLRRLGPGWTTYFPVGIKNFWGKNITIPAAKIDGTVLQPGELFDFWKRIEPVSYAAGYGRGGAIINGKTEKTGALAGGICSASTTMFNAAARAGLEMGARRNHYYYINRYPVGLDATVFKSDGGATQTMSFKNDTKGVLIIRGTYGYGWVRFEIYGIPDGRRASFSRAATWNYRASSDSIEYTRSLPPGVRERVESPVTGFDASVTRTVRDKSGKVIHRNTWFSHYAAIKGILLIGSPRSAPAPAAPAEDTSSGAGDAPGTGGGG